MERKQFRVVVIGAGMAGILAAIKLKEAGYDNICVYEKADRVGGTWRENTYPGLTCDVPSHHYTYSFERNPDWTRHLPPGAEIQRYFQDIEKKYQLRQHICFNTSVQEAHFRNGQWQLKLGDGRMDEAKVVIAATGVLHHPSLPQIPGMDTFSGAMFHSARWDHSVALEGKCIGVIGMGSTGVQIVSELTARGVKVKHFVRTPQWIMPTENGYFSAEERAAFRNDPELLNETMDFEGYTAAVDRYTSALIESDTAEGRILGDTCRHNLEQSIVDDDLRKALTPDHEPLCKRLIFSPDYYQAIQMPSTKLIRSDIKCIEPKGIRTADGKLHQVDVVALATGFRADQFMRPITITGSGGKNLEELWSKRPVAYLAISMPGFPNFFMLNGPNGPVGNFSLIDIAEKQWGYISQLLEKLQAGVADEISASPEALDAFDQERIEAAKQTIWYTGGCDSWYLDAEGIPGSWPWTYSKFVQEMRAPIWNNYVINKYIN
jgi:cation diffusion facilitator CzcD-associated flavoprotein CzcO